jgi:hypothetical protein
MASVLSLVDLASLVLALVVPQVIQCSTLDLVVVDCRKCLDLG